ncbi:MAG: hypothetical protein JXK07_05660 [Spirochaetes bacterium]|nr:hypothetical protein [Spirochaetota bacterium]MBN2769159.1 hypothetical protein [Spirochaetota bacterium]
MGKYFVINEKTVTVEITGKKKGMKNVDSINVDTVDFLLYKYITGHIDIRRENIAEIRACIKV